MLKDQKYTRCIVKTDSGIETCWILDKYAIPGKNLKLCIRGIWKNHCQILTADLNLTKELFYLYFPEYIS